MADVVDMAAELQDEHLALSLQRARLQIAEGVAGECDQCFEDSARLVGGRCAFCRDGRRRATNPTGKRPTPAPALPMEDTVNPKSIQLPATAQAAIKAVEQHAQRNVLSLGAAAAELIERGLQPAPASVPETPVETPVIDFETLIELLRARFDDRPDQSAALAEATARADAAEARATAAETRLTKLREALAA
jgi:hypothetical protein